MLDSVLRAGHPEATDKTASGSETDSDIEMSAEGADAARFHKVKHKITSEPSERASTEPKCETSDSQASCLRNLPQNSD